MFKVSKKISRLIQIWLEYFRKNPRPSWEVFGQNMSLLQYEMSSQNFNSYFQRFPAGHDNYIYFSILFEASRHANDMFKVFRSITIQIYSNTSWIRSKQSEIFLKLFEQGKATFVVQNVRSKFEKIHIFQKWVPCWTR